MNFAFQYFDRVPDINGVNESYLLNRVCRPGEVSQDCYLQQIHFDELAPILRKMKTLQLLNINGNRVNAEYLSCKVLCDPYEDVLDEFL